MQYDEVYTKDANLHDSQMFMELHRRKEGQKNDKAREDEFRPCLTGGQAFAAA
jgi:hypothetical protein